jgi:hypothetical protein
MLYNSGSMWPSVVVHEHWPVSQRMIVEMGDYAWSEHIVTVFLAWKSFFVTLYRRSCKGLAPTKHFISGQPHYGHNCFWGWGCNCLGPARGRSVTFPVWRKRCISRTLMEWLTLKWSATLLWLKPPFCMPTACHLSGMVNFRRTIRAPNQLLSCWVCYIQSDQS